MLNPTELIAAERRRVQREYDRRARELSPDRYASSQPAERFMIETRSQRAAAMLRSAGVFPHAGDSCLEVGFGTGGWFHQLREWKLDETDLHGIELNENRAAKAQLEWPNADLRVGDAVELPWRARSFRLVIASTLFTSILSITVRQLIAEEIERVLAPGGALLWYDFAYNNPRNPHVRGIKRDEVLRLFPNLRGEIKRITLAPPLARAIVPRAMPLARFLDAVPLFRTHLIAVLVRTASQ